MNAPQKEPVPVQVTLVRRDETEHYNFPAFKTPAATLAKVASINEVYFYDRNTRTHCCEITPSYFLEWLRFDVEWKEEPTEEERDTLDSELWEVERQDDDHYEWCHSAVAWSANNPDRTHADQATYETMDEAREYHNGNHVI